MLLFSDRKFIQKAFLKRDRYTDGRVTEDDCQMNFLAWLVQNHPEVEDPLRELAQKLKKVN